jgi:mycothiol synthase
MELFIQRAGRMSALLSHLFTGPADLQAMIALTQELRQRGQVVYPVTADLFEELAEPEVQMTARLWVDDLQQLVGFAYVSRYQNLVDVFDARLFTPEIEAEMMEWVTVSVKQRNQRLGEAHTLDASALESDLPRLAFMERNGFQRQAESSILMACSLNQPIPVLPLLAGFTIRPTSGETEMDVYLDLWRAAFGTQNMTLEYRRTIMNAPDYLPNLDLVAVAPNGDLAAFCLCQVFSDDVPRAGGHKEGWTDPLGTHPNYRRLGLASALIQAGMRLLQERGIDTALLGTSNQNIAMQRVAERLGFRIAAHTLWYVKSVGTKMDTRGITGKPGSNPD